MRSVVAPGSPGSLTSCAPRGEPTFRGGAAETPTDSADSPVEENGLSRLTDERYRYAIGRQSIPAPLKDVTRPDFNRATCTALGLPVDAADGHSRLQN